MDPGKRKTAEIKNTSSTRIRGSNYSAMAGVGDQESPVLGGRSSWDQGANHHFNPFLVMFMPEEKPVAPYILSKSLSRGNIMTLTGEQHYVQHRLGRFSHGLTPMFSPGGTAEIHLCLLVPIFFLVPSWIQ